MLATDIVSWPSRDSKLNSSCVSSNKSSLFSYFPTFFSSLLCYTCMSEKLSVTDFCFAASIFILLSIIETSSSRLLTFPERLFSITCLPVSANRLSALSLSYGTDYSDSLILSSIGLCVLFYDTSLTAICDPCFITDVTDILLLDRLLGGAPYSR